MADFPHLWQAKFLLQNRENEGRKEEASTVKRVPEESANGRHLVEPACSRFPHAFA
jgi:hypothetical protein